MHLSQLIRFAIISLALCLIPLGAAADEGGDRPLIPEFFEGSRAAGAGHAHSAITSGVDNIYQNPAGTARAPMYVLDGNFTHTPAGLIMGAGILDSMLNPQLAVGVSYNYFSGTGDHEHLSGHDARAAVGIPVVPEQVSIGAGVRLLRITDTTIDDSLEDVDDQYLISGLTFDAGVNIRASDLLHLGLVGRNLIDHCADDGRCTGATPTRISAGIGAGDETMFLLSAEGTADLTSGDEPLFEYAFGAEYLADQSIPLRIGYERRNYLDRHLITAGLGWRSEEFGIDAAYRHDLNDSANLGYVTVGFSAYF